MRDPVGPPNADPPVRPDLLKRAQSLIEAGQRRLLGITGPPGSGKSTLARQLAAALGDAAICVPMDGFHLAQCVLDSLGLSQRKGAPETFDADGFRSLLHRLKTTQERVVYAPDFHRDIEEPIAGSIPVPRSVPLVIVEGNYLLLDDDRWSGTADLIDEIWYLDVPAELRQQRLIARHQSFGRTLTQARAWALGSDEMNARLVETGRDRADLVVSFGAPP